MDKMCMKPKRDKRGRVACGSIQWIERDKDGNVVYIYGYRVAAVDNSIATTAKLIGLGDHNDYTP